MEYDFSGWATRHNLKCSDGRTIMKDAFADQSGTQVPLVWNHQHDSAFNVLGHAILENRPEGVYAYCKFNNSESGLQAKELLHNGDIKSLSIWANKLKEQNGNVFHGVIRELSLVLAGANPGARIEYIAHSEDDDDDTYSIYYYNDDDIEFKHADDSNDSEKTKEEPKMADKEKTVQDVIDSMNEEQKKVLIALVGAAYEEAKNDNDESEEKEEMKHNAFDDSFDNGYTGNAVLSHADQENIIKEGRKGGSLRDAVIAHTATYGIDQIDWLFPEAKNVQDGAPSFINIQPQEWVKIVMNGVHHTPFSRIKSMFADIREDEARAKGYIKGNQKKTEVFTLLKRTTDPQTVYKLQKFDRDDVIDITDFDVIAWVKAEMRMKLDEELARAFLVSDGRLPDSDDKISESHIRPIYNDADLYTIKKEVALGSGETLAHGITRTIIEAFNDYQGSGNPIMFTSNAIRTTLLLQEDGIGRRLYNNVNDLATALMVDRIVPMPYIPEGVAAIIVNLNDYNVGADKGGSVNMFEDFDIDFNQQKYLIETRCSGALIKPFSAITISLPSDASPEEPVEEDPNSVG